ncbi:hypothetical protein EV175_000234 [Coemansia sp. RSA 1933]|nr:hypothetical protein EV175_000234 [Coemansia sp. RSA 1933]
MYAFHLILGWFLAVASTLVAGSPEAEGALTRRIVGGYPIEEKRGSFAVYIRRLDSDGMFHVCGGSILSPEYIITAAHCVVDSSLTTTPAAAIVVSYGSVKMFKQTSVTAVGVTVHPNYLTSDGQRDRTNDVAIIQIPRLVFTSTVQRIALYALPVGSRELVTALGWGYTETGYLSTVLRGATLVTGTLSDCQKLFPEYTTNGPLICTPGKYTPGVSSCGGDSGTGAVIWYKGWPMLAAFDSHVRWNGQQTCSADTSVHYYVHAVYHLDFIMTATKLSKRYLCSY